MIRFLFVKSAKYLPGNSPQGTPVSLGSFCFFLVAQPVGFPVHQGITWVSVCFFVMSVVQCPHTLAVHFPPTVYRSAGSAQVLPDLVKSLDIANVQCIQVVPNGIVRVTFKESAQCDAALASGVSFRGSKLRVSPVDARTRLVYVRDLPAKVSDEPVSIFLHQCGVVHSLSAQFHPGLPGVKKGTRVAKVTLLKDLPSSVRIAGFDVRLWYQGQPQSCPVCRQFGHRVRDCPLNGLCRRCRQPGHMAWECSSRHLSATVDPVPASSVDPPMSVADEEEDLEYVCSSALEPGDCSGDEEVVRGASLVELASRMRKRALSKSFVDVSAVIESGDLSYFTESSLGGSQPSLSSAVEPSDPAVSEPSVPAVPKSDPVPRSLPPPPQKKRFVDLPPSGFSSEQVADALIHPYNGILPRTSYAHVCPDAVKPDVPVVMDFGYLTRSVLADYCTFELDRFVKYVHRKFTRVVASPVFPSSVAVSEESLPASTPAKFPGQ